jgi:hypothetical protein
MQALNFSASTNPAMHPPKGIAPWLSAVGDIYIKYFGDKPTKLSLQEVRDEVVVSICYLPLRELAAVMTLVDVQYADMKNRMA